MSNITNELVSDLDPEKLIRIFLEGPTASCGYDLVAEKFFYLIITDDGDFPHFGFYFPNRAVKRYEKIDEIKLSSYPRTDVLALPDLSKPKSSSDSYEQKK